MKSTEDNLKLLEQSRFIKSYDVLTFREFTDGFFLKMAINLVDESKLFFKEYTDNNERNYSFHWQDEQNILIARWDNAPFHPEIETFPHHLHDINGIHPSYNILLSDVIEFIEAKLSKQS